MGRKKRGKKPFRSVSVPEKIYKKLDELSEALGATKGKTVRIAVERFYGDMEQLLK